MLFDTNFLIALQKGSRDATREDCRLFLARYPGVTLQISRITWFEFVSGFDSEAEADPYLHGLTILETEPAIYPLVNSVMRNLRKAGRKIGLPDSIIASTALYHRVPVVTNNAEHFKRIPGLVVLSY